MRGSASPDAAFLPCCVCLFGTLSVPSNRVAPLCRNVCASVFRTSLASCASPSQAVSLNATLPLNAFTTKSCLYRRWSRRTLRFGQLCFSQTRELPSALSASAWLTAELRNARRSSPNARRHQNSSFCASLFCSTFGTSCLDRG